MSCAHSAGIASPPPLPAAECERSWENGIRAREAARGVVCTWLERKMFTLSTTLAARVYIYSIYI